MPLDPQGDGYLEAGRHDPRHLAHQPLRARGGAERIARGDGQRTASTPSIAIGGEGTLAAAKRLTDAGIKIVGVPKTIDNDLAATDYTFGFDTAVQIATEAMDRLRTTGDSHDRCMVAEVMGRHVGWIALHSGMAAGAHAILIPERPSRSSRSASGWSRPRDRGRAPLIVVAEGFKLDTHGRRALERRALTPSAARGSAASASSSPPRSRSAPASRPARPRSATFSAVASPIGLRPGARDPLRDGRHRVDPVTGTGAGWSPCVAPRSCTSPSRTRSAASSRPADRYDEAAVLFG